MLGHLTGPAEGFAPPRCTACSEAHAQQMSSSDCGVMNSMCAAHLLAGVGPGTLSLCQSIGCTFCMLPQLLAEICICLQGSQAGRRR